MADTVPAPILDTLPCPMCTSVGYTWARTTRSVESFKPYSEMSTSGMMIQRNAVFFMRRCERCRNVQWYGPYDR